MSSSGNPTTTAAITTTAAVTPATTSQSHQNMTLTSNSNSSNININNTVNTNTNNNNNGPKGNKINNRNNNNNNSNNNSTSNGRRQGKSARNKNDDEFDNGNINKNNQNNYNHNNAIENNSPKDNTSPVSDALDSTSNQTQIQTQKRNPRNAHNRNNNGKGSARKNLSSPESSSSSSGASDSLAETTSSTDTTATTTTTTTPATDSKKRNNQRNNAQKNNKNNNKKGTLNDDNDGTDQVPADSRTAADSQKPSNSGQNKPNQGKQQKSKKNTNVCKYFISASGCSQGENCKFSHVVAPAPSTSSTANATSQSTTTSSTTSTSSTSSTSSASSTTAPPVSAPSVSAPSAPPAQIRKSTVPICRFFLQGQCSSGENCRFRHASRNENSNHNNNNSNTNKPATTAAKPAPTPASAPPPPKLLSLTELSPQQLQALKESELSAVSKRFSNFSTTPSTEEEGALIVRFDMTPSDPEWPYTLEVLKLQLTLPANYPAAQLKFQLLPIAVPEKFCTAFNKYLIPQITAFYQQLLSVKVTAEQIDAQTSNNNNNSNSSNTNNATTLAGTAPQPTTTLTTPATTLGQPAPFSMIRPFMRWLDKNLEKAFVESGRLMRKQEEISRLGIKIISPSELRSKLYGKDEEPSSNSTAGATTTATTATKQESEKENNEEKGKGKGKEKDKEKEKEKGKQASQVNKVSEDIFDGVDDISEDGNKQESESGDENGEDDDEEEESSENENEEDEEEDEDEEDEGNDDEGDDDEENTNQPEEPLLTQTKQASVPRGTEIRLLGLELTNIALLRMEQVHLVLHCTRCKNELDIHVQGLSSPTVSCSKCSTTASVHFRPTMVHSGSYCLGYLTLASCLPIDCVLLDSVVALQCFACMQDTVVKSNAIVVGETRTHSCRNCHSSMSVKAAGVSFVKHGGEANSNSGGSGDSSSASTSSTGGDKIKRTNKIKSVKDPNIRPGFPLPNLGSCSHYKKSYRWFRFPCCGRAYPCDECHEKNNTDGHAIAWATRMICGYCAKEQNFSNKPCSCGESLTGDTSSRYWEGGQGCRNKAYMSKKDKHKYSNSKLKTQSKKHERVSQKSSKNSNNNDE